MSASSQDDSSRIVVSDSPATRRWPYERRIFAWLLLLASPGLALAAVVLLAIGAPLSIWLFGWLPVACLCAALAITVRNKAGYPLRTLANLIEALRQEDYALRGVAGAPPGALYELITEINQLGEDLREKRFVDVEADLLLGKIVEELDTAVLAFDDSDRLTLINSAGAAIFAADADDLVGRQADSMGLVPFLGFNEPQVEQCTFPGKQGRFRIQASRYRQGGVPQKLLVLTDLSLTLREEERLAWQRLIRVIGHELNNSLTPIRSMADSLASMLELERRPPDWDSDARAGLDVIRNRAEALSEFMGDYAELTRLPAPDKAPVSLAELLGRVAALDTGWPVELEERSDMEIDADATQLEQLLINLIKNAGEANEAAGSTAAVRISWRNAQAGVEIDVIDGGAGLPDSGNLFTPFFSTKAGGSGVGLLLGRQIAEAHGGSLQVSNREDGPTGCRARVSLPGPARAVVD